MENKKQNGDGKKLLNLYQLGNWGNREYMKHFFDYGDTQILELSRNKAIITSRIGNRQFFELNSIKKFLEDHIEPKKKDQ